jgi:hypothetical protein
MPPLIGRGGFGLPTLYKLLGGAADFQVAVAFQLAQLVPGTVHAFQDASLPPGLVPIDTTPADGGLTNAIRLANVLQPLLLAHLKEVGTSTAPGAHLAADAAHATTLAAVAPATDLPSCAALGNALQVAINGHLTAAGVHFHNDVTAVDATPAATDLPSTVTMLDNIAKFIVAHFGRIGVTPGFTR